MMREAEAILDEALQIFRDCKVQGGEIYVEDHTVFSVGVASGKIESLETQDVRGAGLRVFDRGHVAFSYTSDVSVDGLRESALMAKSLLPLSDPDEANRLPEADAVTASEPDINDPLLARVDPQEKIGVARKMEEAARASDTRVTRVRLSRYTDAIGCVGVAGTAGLRRIWPFTRAYASIELNAEQGSDMQSGYYADFAIRFSGLDPVHVGREAARHAVQKLGATRTPTRRTNLVLEPSVAASLLESIAPALYADNVLKGKSLMGPRAGQAVAASKVTLLDDGRLPGADHSWPYDAEGVATRPTMLIEGGVLKGFLHSAYTSMRMNSAPTGNASRRSFLSPPRIAPSNLYLHPTGITREALMAEAGNGIFITEVMGLHTIDPISGDFSLGASGLELRAGRMEGPVDRIGIAGNVMDLLRSIGGVAGDVRLMPGGGAGSTTLLADISVSGT